MQNSVLHFLPKYNMCNSRAHRTPTMCLRAVAYDVDQRKTFCYVCCFATNNNSSSLDSQFCIQMGNYCLRGEFNCNNMSNNLFTHVYIVHRLAKVLLYPPQSALLLSFALSYHEICTSVHKSCRQNVQYRIFTI